MSAANAEMLSQLEQINPAGPPRGCIVTIRNSAAAEREAVIIAAGVHFFYSDGDGKEAGDYLAGPVHVELPSGASAPFKSSDPRRKVTKLVVGVRVRFGDKDDPKSQTFNFTKEVDAPVLMSNPPQRTLIINQDVEFRVMDKARFSVADAQHWYELGLRRVEP